MLRFAVLALSAAVIAGCGSADADDLPRPAEPRSGPAAQQQPAGEVENIGTPLPLSSPVAALGRGTQLAVVDGRDRVVELFDARTGDGLSHADAGVGPTNLATDGVELIYVVDTEGDALLVFHTRPELELVRRVYLPGSPYGIAIDRKRRRLWVTLTERNAVAELTAGSRPRPLAELPSVRDPVSIAVDPASGTVSVSGRDGRLQVVEPS